MTLEVPMKRERNAAETKKRLLDAAEREFSAKGFAGARLGTIARAAGVQQALIHHYFSDKAGLYRAVIERAVGAMSTQGLEILQGFSAQPTTAAGIKQVAIAFTEMLSRFAEEHGALVMILRHDAEDEGSVASQVIQNMARPVFDAVVAYVDSVKAQGLIRSDVDGRHLCVSALSMALGPVLEARLIREIWPVNVKDRSFIVAQRKEFTTTILARLGIDDGSAS